MGHFCCFSQSSMASLTALPSAPLLPPYFEATLTLNLRSRPSGMMTMVRPIFSPVFSYAVMFISIFFQYVTEGEVQGW